MAEVFLEDEKFIHLGKEEVITLLFLLNSWRYLDDCDQSYNTLHS